MKKTNICLMNWLLTICFISEVGLSTPSHVEPHESSHKKTAFMQKVLIGGFVCSFLQDCYKSSVFNARSHSIEKQLDNKLKINHLENNITHKVPGFIGEGAGLDLLEKSAPESFWKNDCLTSDDVKGWRCGHSDCLDFSEEIKCSEYNKFLEESNQSFKCACEESRENKKEYGLLIRVRPISVPLYAPVSIHRFSPPRTWPRSLKASVLPHFDR